MSLRQFALSCTFACVIGATASALGTASLELSGGDDALRSGLNAALLLNALEDDASPAEILAAAQADYANLLEVLYASGHYGASVRILLDGVEAALIPPLAPPAQVQAVRIAVTPGPTYRLGRANIAPRAPGTEAPEGFAPGASAEADAIREATRGAVENWRSQGHAKARVTDQSIVARHAQEKLDVDVTLTPGAKARFGEVTVQGDTNVRPARVRQIAGLPKGETFDPDTVERAARRLRATGTFQSVTLQEAETLGPDGALDIEITTVDRKPRRINAGAEISSLDGATLSASWLHRNILGGAERLRLEGEITHLAGGTGGPDLTLGARFEKPAVYGPDTLFFALAELHYLDEPDFLDQGGEVGAGVTREFSDRLTGDLGLSLSYSHVTDRFAGRDASGAYPTRSFTILSMPTALTWDRRDDRLNPTKGSYIQTEFEPFSYLSGRGVGGARLGLDARGYQQLGARLVLAGRLQLGSTVGPEARDAPPEYLYYSGGGGTVRGQPFQSLDADHNGTRLGGRSFAGLGTELRAKVTDKVSLVGFADFGFVGADADFGMGDWHAGAGLGVRYDTTIGPVRVDVAGPIGGDTGKGLQLYVGIGQAF